MKLSTVLILSAVAGLAVVIWRRRQTASLREDKPAPELPKSSDILAGRPQTNSPFSQPTLSAGIAPAWKWGFDTVANIFAQGGNN